MSKREKTGCGCFVFCFRKNKQKKKNNVSPDNGRRINPERGREGDLGNEDRNQLMHNFPEDESSIQEEQMFQSPKGKEKSTIQIKSDIDPDLIQVNI